MRLYCNDNRPEQVDNVKMFHKIMERFPWIVWYHPNKDKAPWHLQAKIDCITGVPVFLNAWPHKGKVAWDSGKPVVGYEAIRELIAEAIEYTIEQENEVLE